MSTELATIHITALTLVTGGRQRGATPNGATPSGAVSGNVNGNVNATVDLNGRFGILDQAGEIVGAALRPVTCLGADSRREYFNCLQTGSLGNVPPSSTTSGTPAPAP
jgi:hypothetical protein